MALIILAGQQCLRVNLLALDSYLLDRNEGMALWTFSFFKERKNPILLAYFFGSFSWGGVEIPPVPPQLGNCAFLLRGLREYNLSDVKMDPQFKQLSPLLWASARGVTYGHELDAAAQLAALLAQPVLVAGEFLGQKGIPAFDGVIFNNDGTARSNVSFKSIFVGDGKNPNLGGTAVHARGTARSSLNTFYFGDFFTDRGFIVDGDYMYTAKGTRSQEKRSADMESFIKLFGVSPIHKRKTTVVLHFNFEEGTTRDFQIHIYRKVLAEQYRNGKEDVCMTVDRDPSSGKLINLTHISENLKEDPYVDEYIFMMGKQVVRVSADGIQTIPPVKVE
jgi:hypothetical protein